MALDRRLKVEPLEERRMLATFTVTNLLDGPVTAAGQLPGSLRQAIFDANAAFGANEIEFSGVMGTLSLTNGEMQISDALTIEGPGAELLTIDAQHQSRIFNIDKPDVFNESFPTTLSGMKLTSGKSGGAAYYFALGGAIRSYTSGILTVNDCVITGNKAASELGGRGGGIYALGSVVTNDCLITYNRVDDDFSFSGYSSHGGGVFSQGSVTLTRSTVSGNDAEGDGSEGGGIYAAINVTVIESTISGNDALGDDTSGGGIFARGNVVVDRSTIDSNRTFSSSIDGAGGGIFSCASVTVISSTLSNNTAQSHDSVYCRDLLTASNSTISGGGLRALDGIILTGTIVEGAFGPMSLNLTASYSLISDTSGLSGAALDAVVNGVGNVFDQNPFLDVLAYNGGPTRTHALTQISPALDAGNPAVPADPATYDQRGAPHLRVLNGRIDIGAFEGLVATTPLVVNNSGDFNDGDLFNGVTTLREAIGAANATIQTDTILFDAVMAGQTITLGGTQLTATAPVFIDASALSNPVVIDANLQSRVFNFDATFGRTDHYNVYFNNLTVKNGWSTSPGGAIFSSSTGLMRVIDCGIFDSGTTGVGAHGGGISTSGDLWLTHTEVSGNFTTGNSARGGGIRGGRLTMEDSTVNGNSTSGFGSRGGGLSVGPATITNSAISGNHTLGNESKGGGISTSDISLIDSLVSNNFTIGVSAWGGGISGGNVTLVRSTLDSNYTSGSTAFGGGISADRDIIVESSVVANNSTAGSTALGGGISGIGVTISNSTLSGNFTTGGSAVGGGIYARSATINNSTVADNRTVHATSNGGGLYLGNRLTLRNSIIADNVSEGLNKDLYFVNNAPTVNYSLIGNTSGLSATHIAAINAGTGNLLNVDPLLGPLQDNGGATFTHAPLSGSPAIDSGDPAFTPPPEYDQRGIGFSRVVAGRTDIGALESQPVPASADFDNDGDVDGRDFLKWQRGESPDPLSSGDLVLWQEEYGASELLVASGELRDSQELRAESREPESSMAPWAVSLLSTTRAVGPCYGCASDDDTAFEDSYAEEVDRALEHLSSTTLLGKPAVAPFGEMVARRGVRRIADLGLRNAE